MVSQCCLSFMRVYIIMSSIAMTLVALACLGLGIYYKSTSMLKDLMTSFLPDSTLNILSTLEIILAAILSIGAIIGIYGSFWKKKFALIIFALTNFVTFCVLVGGVVVCEVWVQPWIDGVKANKQCTNGDNLWDQLLYESDQLYQQAQKNYFCRLEYGCECQIRSPQEWKNRFGPNFFNNYYKSSNTGAEKFQQCPNLTQVLSQNPSLQNYFNSYNQWAELMEKWFYCSGICVPLPTYVFSDINRGIPSNNDFPPSNQKACKQELQDFAWIMYNVVKYLCIGADVLIIINIVFIILFIKRSVKQQFEGVYMQMY